MIRKLMAKVKEWQDMRNRDRVNGRIEQRVMQKPTWKWLWRERINDWHVMSGQSRHTESWAAWAKRTPLVERDPLSEPGDVYFERGQSRQEAIDRLTASDLIA